MATSPICYIDKLPNETLFQIFSNLAASHDVDSLKSGHGWTGPRVAAILILRWVSQRFRTIVDELDFWHDDSFDITDYFVYRSDQPRWRSRYIRKLFEDDGLNRALSRKTAWQFPCIYSFNAIVTIIPDLPRNIRKVCFSYFATDTFNVAIDYLAAFKSLTDLKIELCLNLDDRGALPLEPIFSSCPLLETLEVSDLTNCDGPLPPTAHNLRKLNFTFASDKLIILTWQFFRRMPNIKSLGIDIHQPWTCGASGFHVEEAGSFRSLVHFETQSLNSSLCTFLIHGDFTLTSLNVDYWRDGPDPPLETVLAIFNAPALRGLRQLQFRTKYFFNFEPTLDISDQILSAITNLRHLETLELVLAVCCTSWLKRCAQLSRLKSISLGMGSIVFGDYNGMMPLNNEMLIAGKKRAYYERRVKPSHSRFQRMRKERIAEVKRRLDYVFSEFDERPCISVCWA